MNHTSPMKTLSRALMLLLLAAGIFAAPAQAQDDQAYKKEYNAALEAYKAKKVDEAYNHWLKASDLAKKAGDQDIAAKSIGYVAQLDYARGVRLLKAEKYDEAVQHFDKGISHDPNVADNYYGKGLALKNLDKWDEALALYQKAIEVAEKTSDRKVAQTARDAIRGNYIFLASSALTRNGQNTSKADAQEAIQHLNKLLEVIEPDADAHYYFAEAYKVLGDYAKSVAEADKALELHKGSKTDKAKIYFVKGEALMLSGDNAGARAAFSEARFGSYKAPAEHFLETLGTN